MFYQFPNSNLFTHRMLFYREKPLVKSMAPGVYFPSYIFRSIKPKIQKYLTALYFIRDLFIPSIIFLSCPFANFWRCYPEGIDNPFNTSDCEYLLFVCTCCLRSFAWFSYWFDNLGFITEGNTYRMCAASSLPLWGKYERRYELSKGNFWHRCRGDIINIYQVPSHKSHLLEIYIICHLPLVFISPTSQN